MLLMHMQVRGPGRPALGLPGCPPPNKAAAEAAGARVEGWSHGWSTTLSQPRRDRRPAEAARGLGEGVRSGADPQTQAEQGEKIKKIFASHFMTVVAAVAAEAHCAGGIICTAQQAPRQARRRSTY